VVTSIQPKREPRSRVSRQGEYFGVLEPYDGKLSRTVLRGVGSRKAPCLPGGRQKQDSLLLSDGVSWSHERGGWNMSIISRRMVGGLLVVVLLGVAGCGGGGTTSTAGNGATNTNNPVSVQRDLSNVTDYNKVGNTIIAAVNLMNDKITNNSAYSDALLNLNTIEFEVPIQNYLGSNVMTDVIKATITADTIKKGFPVSASATKTPYSLTYKELDSSGTSLNTFRLNYIPLGSCSNSQNIKDPTAECISYSYEILTKNTSGLSVNSSGSNSISVVKTTSSAGLTSIRLPIN